MGKVSRKKRPCCICRKWFQPDVRQQDRQQTCGRPDCTKELHRRNCEKWNKRNKDYFANNYLAKKIEQIAEPESEKGRHVQSGPSSKKGKPLIPANPSLILPREIIINEYGVKGLIIIHYLAIQIIAQIRGNKDGIP